MTTGVDAQTCKPIVLDQRIQSMTEFKQIIGRGTRINEDYNKFYFTIIDFKKATELFADPDFDGDPVQIYTPKDPDDSPVPPDEPSNEESGDATAYPLMSDDIWKQNTIPNYIHMLQANGLPAIASVSGCMETTKHFTVSGMQQDRNDDESKATIQAAIDAGIRFPPEPS